MRALYSAISGMSANGTKIDVIGDNVTNSSTTAFRSSDVRFETLLCQNEKDASGPSGNLGGSNPSQVGLGVQIASINVINKSGTLQASGGILDTAIDDLDGNDYYIISKGVADYKDNSVKVSQTQGSHSINSDSVSSAGQEIEYIRDGGFSEDEQGNIVTADGYRVMGYSLSNDTANQDATALKPNSVKLNGFTFSFGPGTDLNGYQVELGNIGAGTSVTAKVDTSNKKIILSGDFSSDNQVSANQAEDAINGALSSNNIAQTVLVNGKSSAIKDIVGTISATKDGSGKVTGASFTNSDTPSGSSGNIGGLTFAFTTDDANHSLAAALDNYKIEIGNISKGTTASATIDTKNKVIIVNGDFQTPSSSLNADIQNAINTALSDKGIITTPSTQKVTVGGAAVADLKDESTDSTIGETAGTMTPDAFDSGSVSGTIGNSTKGKQGTPAQSIDSDGTINFIDGTKTLYAYDTSLKALRIPKSVYNIATGTTSDVKSFKIDANGIITASLADGTTAAIGQMAMAKFANQGGLEKIGDNMYQETANSGNAIIKSGINTTGDDNSGAFGQIRYHELEGSNVDLAEQFSDLIVAERAFQADGKIINTGDDILQDIINLKR